MVYGLVDPDGAQGSTPRGLDGLFELDIAQELPALELGSIDTIVYADVLSRFTDPLAILGFTGRCCRKRARSRARYRTSNTTPS